MIVYLDVVIIENFLINFFLITITMQLLNIKSKYIRIGCASFFGSLYTLTMFLESLMIFNNIIFKMIVVILMLKLVIFKKNLFFLIKATSVFFIISIAFSGFCFLFAMAENPYNITGVFTIKNYSSKNLLFSIIILYLTINRIYAYIKDRCLIKTFIYDLEFLLNGQVINVKGFLDTGNELSEPVTTLPVIILEQSLMELNIVEISKDIFYIPYKLVNGTNNVIEGVKVENIKIKSKDYEKEIDAIVAFSDVKLSRDNDFNALLPRGIL